MLYWFKSTNTDAACGSRVLTVGAEVEVYTAKHTSTGTLTSSLCMRP